MTVQPIINQTSLDRIPTANMTKSVVQIHNRALPADQIIQSLSKVFFQSTPSSPPYQKKSTPKVRIPQTLEEALCLYENISSKASYKTLAKDPHSTCMTKMVSILQHAAKERNAQAQAILGECYIKGIGIQKDIPAAIRFFQAAAKQGSPLAQNNLGYCYEKGMGVAQDINEAFRLFEVAASQGFAKAQHNLGWCYVKGLGVAKDPSKAAYFFQLAANRNLALAQFTLSSCYKRGFGVAKDIGEAIKALRLSANNGFALAQYTLSICHEKGISMPIDRKESLRLCQLAANQGFILAKLALKIHQGKEIDAQTISSLQESVDQGSAKAQFALSLCYKNGAGVEQNTQKATQLLQLAANQYFAPALYTVLSTSTQKENEAQQEAVTALCSLSSY